MKKITILILFNLCAFSQNKFNSKIDSLLTIVKTEKSETKKVTLFTELIKLYTDITNVTTATQYNDSILRISKKNNFNYGIALYYFNNILIYKNKEDSKNCIFYAKKARQLFLKNKKWEYFFKSSNLLAQNLFETAQRKEAKIIAINSLNYAIKYNNTQYMGLFYKNLGIVNWELGLFDQAMSNNKKAIKYAIKSQDYNLEHNIYFNISQMYAKTNQYNEALKYVNLALRYYTAKKDILQMITVLIGKAGIIHNMGNPKRSLELYLLAQDVINKNKLSGSPTHILNKLRIGTAYHNLGKYNLAITYLQSIINNLKFNKTLENEANLFLCHSYSEVNNLERANFFIDKLLVNIKDLKDNNKIMVYKAKSEIEAKLKNYESALKYHELYSTASEDFNELIQEKQIQKLHIEFDVALKDNKISKLEIEKLKKDSDLKNRKIIIFFMTGFLILFSLLIYLLLKSNKKIKIKNNIIALSNSNLQQAQNETKKSLAEKDVLLKEIHHRVKNNLQLIMSLLRVQGNKYDNIIFDDFLDISESRISSMALVHEKLYQSDDLTQINFNEYVVNMTNDISDTFQSTEDKVKIDFDLIPIKFDVQTLIPLALIINELVINAFKHAFKNRKAGRILIKLLQEEEKNILIISDNGAGITIDKDKKSIGLKLVKQLVFQLKAELEIKNFEGTKYQITFKTI